MKISEFSVVVEKYGYLVSDVIEIPSGISKKTGKPFDSFSMLKVLIHGQSDVTTFSVDAACLDEIKEAIEPKDYLTPVKVVGIQNATGAFKVTAVEDWEGAK